MVEAGGSSEVRRPDLGRVTDSERSGRTTDIGRGCLTQGIVRALESGKVRGKSLGKFRRHRPEALAKPRYATGRQEELARRQQHRLVDRAHGSLIGRVERPQRVDLVAEELEPDRQREGRREDVDDAAPARELAPAGDFEDGDVPEIEQLPQERVLADTGAEPDDAHLGREVIGGDRVLEERLHARHEDPGTPAAPRGKRCDTGCGLVGDQLAPLVGQRGARLEHRDGLRVAEPGAELLGDAIADLRVTCDPHEALLCTAEDERRGQVRLRAVGNAGEPGVTAPGRERLSGTQAFAKRSERLARRQERRQRGEVGQATAGTARTRL